MLDTRKTTPGLRRLEKMAAAAGGVTNHRIGLFDAILIKNNHIAAAGGVRAAMDARARAGLPIEIEVRTRAELDEALAAGATHLLLDNLTPAEAAEWVREIAGRAKVEISGGITLENVRAYAESGRRFRLLRRHHPLRARRRTSASGWNWHERWLRHRAPRARASRPRASTTSSRLDSTMTEAARLAAEGCAAGTAVVAEEQTAGQGRHGHTWHSEPGAGLYCSIVLRPALTAEDMPA